jgi:hypothetical protein
MRRLQLVHIHTPYTRTTTSANTSSSVCKLSLLPEHGSKLTTTCLPTSLLLVPLAPVSPATSKAPTSSSKLTDLTLKPRLHREQSSSRLTMTLLLLLLGLRMMAWVWRVFWHWSNIWRTIVPNGRRFLISITAKKMDFMVHMRKLKPQSLMTSYDEELGSFMEHPWAKLCKTFLNLEGAASGGLVTCSPMFNFRTSLTRPQTSLGIPCDVPFSSSSIRRSAPTYQCAYSRCLRPRWCPLVHRLLCVRHRKRYLLIRHGGAGPRVLPRQSQVSHET